MDGIFIMKIEKYNSNVHFIGKINKTIYGCIAEDLVTEDVIITEERVRHIKERHPNDYEMYCNFLKESVESPDFIIETKKVDTALILKEFPDTKKQQLKIVLRLITVVDNPKFKNSIITFIRINEKEWERLLRNMQILYKRE